ncbi:MAG TPA: hemerythrin domain-containing protein [Candidatus Binatia bacterium]|nr:hemerythrin domain-containing protein [Candidatus Binatia bacterium]
MSQPWLKIQEDHTNTLRLLNLLEHQAGVMEEGGQPDWELIQGLIDYFLAYPDLRHHPLEDRILERMEARSPGEAAPFRRLQSEHQVLGRKLRQLAAATQALLQDELTEKSAYLDQLRDFIATQHNHMQREEAQFLPAARRILEAADWQALAESAAPFPDPLRDPDDTRFQNLRRQLLKWDAEDRRAARPTPHQI